MFNKFIGSFLLLALMLSSSAMEAYSETTDFTHDSKYVVETTLVSRSRILGFNHESLTDWLDVLLIMPTENILP